MFYKWRRKGWHPFLFLFFHFHHAKYLCQYHPQIATTMWRKMRQSMMHRDRPLLARWRHFNLSSTSYFFAFDERRSLHGDLDTPSFSTQKLSSFPKIVPFTCAVLWTTTWLWIPCDRHHPHRGERKGGRSCGISFYHKMPHNSIDWYFPSRVQEQRSSSSRHHCLHG